MAVELEGFQSTRPSRGETAGDGPQISDRAISIHSPLAGRDTDHRIGGDGDRRFQSTRPSRGETPERSRVRRATRLFQSTRPSRGETLDLTLDDLDTKISIHSPLAGRDDYQSPLSIPRKISIHSPLAGRDGDGLQWLLAHIISIHSPLAGRDVSCAARCWYHGISIHSQGFRPYSHPARLSENVCCRHGFHHEIDFGRW